MKKTLSALLLVCTLSLPISIFAITQYPSEGGTWEYGNGVALAYSYYTVNKDHGSSIFKDGVAVSISARTAPNKKSIAQKWHAPWDRGYSFYYKIY